MKVIVDDRWVNSLGCQKEYARTRPPEQHQKKQEAFFVVMCTRYFLQFSGVHGETGNNDDQVFTPLVMGDSFVHGRQLRLQGRKSSKLFWGAGSGLEHLVRLHRGGTITQRIESY